MAAGSAGNVIAALASFFIPGLGQLVQGRMAAAVGFGMAWGFLWVLTLAGGAIFSLPLIFCLAIWAALDAAQWDAAAEAARAARPPAVRAELTPEEKREAHRAWLALALLTLVFIGIAAAVRIWPSLGR